MATAGPMLSAKFYIDALSVGLFGAAASANVEAAAAAVMNIPLSEIATTIPTNDQIWAAGTALGQSALFSSLYPSTQSDAAFITAVNTVLTGSSFILPSELIAFQNVLSSGYSRAQAATYLIASVISVNSSALNLNNQPNPLNPNGLSDLQTFQNQQYAALNRTQVSADWALASATASNLNYPVVGPATNTGYLGAQSAELGVTYLSSTVVVAENQIAIARAANDPTLITPLPVPHTNYTLTAQVETVPAFGTLAPNDTVSGITDGDGTTTFQTGDVINGGGLLANNTLTILSDTLGFLITATVNNIAKINHQLLSFQAFDESLYTNIGAETITKGLGGNTLALFNANASTLFGISSSTNDNMNIQLSGAAGQTLKLYLGGAGGSDSSFSTIRSLANTAGNIASATIATSGANRAELNGGTSLTSITITGSGTNDISFGAVGDTSSSGVSIDASATTGATELDLGTNYAAFSSIKGSNSAQTTVELTLTTLVTVSGWTNVSAVEFDGNSNGGTLLGNGNTSIKTIKMDERPGVLEHNTTLNGFQGINSLVFETNGTGHQYFGAINLVGSLSGSNDTLELTFDNKGIPLAVTSNLYVDLPAYPLVLDGAEYVKLNFTNGVGSSGNVRFYGGIHDNNLQNLSITNPGTGGVDLASVSGGDATISSIDASGVGGNFTAAFNNGTANGLANGATVLAAGGSNSLLFMDSASPSNITISDLKGVGSQIIRSVTGSTLTNQGFTILGGDGDYIITKSGLQIGYNYLTDAASNVVLGDGSNFLSLADGNNNVILGDGNADHYDFGNGNNTIKVGNGNAVLIQGGSGNNSITVGNGNGGNVTLGYGNNTISMGNGTSNTIIVGNGDNSVTVGDGSAFIAFGSGTNSITTASTGSNTYSSLSANAGSSEVYSTITGTRSGDILEVSTPSTGAGAVGFVNQSTLTDFITAARGLSATKGFVVDTTLINGVTYVYENTGSFSTDLLVGLTGLHTLIANDSYTVTISLAAG